MKTFAVYEWVREVLICVSVLFRGGHNMCLRWRSCLFEVIFDTFQQVKLSNTYNNHINAYNRGKSLRLLALEIQKPATSLWFVRNDNHTIKSIHFFFDFMFEFHEEPRQRTPPTLKVALYRSSWLGHIEFNGSTLKPTHNTWLCSSDFTLH